MFNFYRSPAHLEEKLKPFDWTFSSDYCGTLSGPFKIVSTDEKIDINRLKEREKILFYHELILYEDELHDNGIATCSVKIVSKNIENAFICFVLISACYAEFVFCAASLLFTC